ncbi:MAG: hypothetical protein NZM06_10420 [Chloroherpetonaceae bacterium]|nr:hypothetical protein [Chloroherpetonaceae bacterium]MDW8437114.1 hypothetical protein [Chloroherpetonaceae bacterium]
MTKAIQRGFKGALSVWQASAWIYAINLLFALGFAMAFKNILSEEFANRDVSARLLEGFDFTFLSDLNYASLSVSSLMAMLGWLVVGYALVSVFLSGGVIATLLRGTFSAPDFFADSARYVGRFLALAVLFGLALLAPLIAFSIFLAIGRAMAESATSEAPLVIWTIVGIAIAFLKGAYFYLVFEVAKFEVVTENASPFRAFASALKIVTRHLASFYGILFAFLVIVSLIALLLHALAPEGKSGAGVFALALTQQAFVASRAFLRVASIGGLLWNYQDAKPKKELSPSGAQVSPSLEPTTQVAESQSDAEIKAESESK